MNNQGSYPTLHQAAMDGDIKTCVTLLRLGHSVNSHDTEGRTVLYCAVANEQMIITELFLKMGADVNLRNFHTGIAPMHYLAMTGNVELIKCLIVRSGYNPGLLNRRYGVEGLLPIHLASQNGHAEVIRLLLGITSRMHVDITSLTGLTPLMYAVQYNQLPVIRVLVEYSANVNFTSSVNGENTALHYAVMNDNKEIVTELLNVGAKISITGKDNRLSPVHYAAVNGYLEMLKLLHENGGSLIQPVEDEKGNLPIHLAAMRGHMDTVRWIQEKESLSVFSWNKLGLMPIHVAAMTSRIDVVEYMVDTAGVYVDVTTSETCQRTAMLIASQLCDYRMISSLISRKADVNKESGDNCYRPLHYATVQNNPHCIKLLQEAGANVHLRYGNEDGTGDGEPLLITAAKHKSHDAAKFLLSDNVGVHPDYRDKDGFAALHYATFYADIQLTKLLLSKGATVNCQDKRMYTPLHYAVENGNASVVEEILRISPSLTIQNVNGMNPVHHAALCGDLPSFQLLIKDKPYLINTPTCNDALDLPIHLAAFGGHLSIISWIIDCGIPFDIRSGSGRTALDIATQKGKQDVMNFLKFIDAHVNRKA